MHRKARVKLHCTRNLGPSKKFAALATSMNWENWTDANPPRHGNDCIIYMYPIIFCKTKYLEKEERERNQTKDICLWNHKLAKYTDRNTSRVMGVTKTGNNGFPGLGDHQQQTWGQEGEGQMALWLVTAVSLILPYLSLQGSTVPRLVGIVLLVFKLFYWKVVRSRKS